MDRELRLIRRLADGALHPPLTLCGHLGIGQEALPATVTQTQDRLGVAIHRIGDRGYRLDSPLELLDADRIRSEIPHETRRHIQRLEIREHLDSTNSYLMREAAKGAPSATLCLAEYQSAGRGRHGRTWVSPYGNNIYLSLLWRYRCTPQELGGLSLAAGTAVAGVLEACGLTQVALKWPNDIQWQDRKLAGLLLEVAGRAQGPSQVVVGVGLNIGLGASQAAHIDQPWVDLSAIAELTEVSRNRFAGRLACQLIRTMQRYGNEGLAPFLVDWERFDRQRGERVQIRAGKRTQIGIHAGITPQGALRLAVAGGIKTFHAGEVSLRPMPKGRIVQ